jgi:deazaflavin-dependent oxidoreductase (nitroreductase family)
MPMQPGTTRPAVRRRSMINSIVGAILRSPASGLLDAKLMLVRYRGRRTGREHELPVSYVQHGHRFLVVVGASDHKTWWRNFSTPQPVEIVVRRDQMSAVARLLPASAEDQQIVEFQVAPVISGQPVTGLGTFDPGVERLAQTGSKQDI